MPNLRLNRHHHTYVFLLGITLPVFPAPTSNSSFFPNPAANVVRQREDISGINIPGSGHQDFIIARGGGVMSSMVLFWIGRRLSILVCRIITSTGNSQHVARQQYLLCQDRYVKNRTANSSHKNDSMSDGHRHEEKNRTTVLVLLLYGPGGGRLTPLLTWDHLPLKSPLSIASCVERFPFSNCKKSLHL